MNKELILKYNEEFNHWLKGGKLLYKHRDAETWRDVNELHMWGELELLYVIDDKYVEFRSALAEGKTVQFNSNFPSKTPEAWIDITKIDIHNTPLSYLRIKPIDTHEFKVGDWVLDTTTNCLRQIIEINDKSIRTSGNGTYNNIPSTCLKLWQPQPNEWCWFNHGYHLNPTLIKYISQDISKCEPFIGNLPQNLKDK